MVVISGARRSCGLFNGVFRCDWFLHALLHPINQLGDLDGTPGEPRTALHLEMPVKGAS